MGHYAGEPIVGQLHSSDASSGVEVPVFNQGSRSARTLQDDEYIVVHSLSLVTAAGGDSYLFASDDGTEDTGEYIVRGNFAANGGISLDKHYFAANPGETIRVVAPAGDVDVRFNGTIRRVGTAERPDWKESNFGQ